MFEIIYYWFTYVNSTGIHSFLKVSQVCPYGERRSRTGPQTHAEGLPQIRLRKNWQSYSSWLLSVCLCAHWGRRDRAEQTGTHNGNLWLLSVCLCDHWGRRDRAEQTGTHNGNLWHPLLSTEVMRIIACLLGTTQLCWTNRTGQSSYNMPIYVHMSIYVYICLFIISLSYIYFLSIYRSDIIEAFMDDKGKFVEYEEFCQMVLSSTDFSGNRKLDADNRAGRPTGESLLIYICNFHVLSHLLLIYICKLHWNLNTMFVCQVNSFWFTYEISMS